MLCYAFHMLELFGPSIYVAYGPSVSFFGFPYPTRMVVIQFADGNLWVWSPVALTTELASAVDSLGRVRYIVSPNKIHHLFLPEWAEHWPDARIYASPGLIRRKPAMHFDAELGDKPESEWAMDIDQVIFVDRL